MDPLAHLSWPFFEEQHRNFARRLSEWAKSEVAKYIDHHDADKSCRDLVKAMGAAGWLSVAAPEIGGKFDVRSIGLAREILAWHGGLADFAFAMQGLGTGPITLFGNDEIKRKYLTPVREGRSIAAFALTEAASGSDVAAITLSATPDGNSHVRLNGEKTWISNGAIAGHYVVFCRTGEAPGAKGISAFVVDGDTPGLSFPERLEVIAPHPLATLRFEDCRVPVANRLGNPGDGFKIAMATLDVFRCTVGAASLGFARRALDEAVTRAVSRNLFGAPLGELQMTQASLADSATELDAAALLVYRAAWTKDSGAARITREAAMAKMFATEAAQQIIDRAVQLFGGSGVRIGSKVEELYREIRALRIYEGATEVQKIIIARDLYAKQNEKG